MSADLVFRKTALGSYRHSFAQHLIPKLRRQPVRGEHINFQPQQLFQLEPNGANVYQRGLRRRLDQQVQITARHIVTAKG